MFGFIGAVAVVAISSNAPSQPEAPKPMGSIEGVFTSEDYPAEALKGHEQGDVGALVRTDAHGAISDCIVEKSSGSAILDKRTCDVIRERVKFKPARDSMDRPIPGEVRQTIKWRIAENWVPSEPWAYRMVMGFGRYGEAVSCRIEVEGAVKPKASPPQLSCPPSQMKRNVAGVTKFGGPIDKLITEERFSLGPASPFQLAPDDVIAVRDVLQIEVDSAGKLTSCKLTEATGEVDRDPCQAIHKEYQARKGSDGKFEPFSATDTLTTIVHLDRARPPEPAPVDGSLQKLFTPDDYPAESLDRGDQGKVGIVIRTDPNGAISDCIVEESSGSKLLDNRACDVVRQRAKFKPALDQQGRSVAGEYRSRIDWKIADEIAPGDPWAIRTVINFAPDGRTLSCHVEFEGAMKPQPGETAPVCDAGLMAKAPPKVADLPGAIGTVVMEQRFTLGSAPPQPLPAGDVLVSRQVVSLDVDADGKLTSCKVIETSGQEPKSDPCSQVDKQYLLHKGRNGLPVPFNATETFIVFVRVEKVALRS